jgi:TPR repeat protein
MAHKVFICHSSSDKQVADAACAALEAQRIPCWIAPRDILAGEEYGKAIVDALSSCQIVLLIFSGHANDSPQVRREIERAVSKGKIIVPFRIEDVMPSDAMEFALSNTHWLDALTPPLAHGLSELCATIARLIQRQSPGTAPEPVFEPIPKQPDVKPPAPALSDVPESKIVSRGFPRWAWGVLAAAALVAVFAVGRLLAPHSQTQPSPGQLTQPAPLTNANPNAADTQPSAAQRSMLPPAAGPKLTVPKPGSLAISQQADALFNQSRFSEAAPLLEQICASGDASSCNHLGLMYQNGLGVARNDSRSVALFSKACSADTRYGCNNLGLMYAGGRGVPQSYSQAVALYSKSCNAGVAVGCGNLGLMYAQGTGVAQNTSQALPLLSKGCDGGNTQACGGLGVMYTEGIGMAQNTSRAAPLLSKGCDSGLIRACNDLGVLYANGNSIPQNYIRAAALYSKACDGNNPIACTNLGNFYRLGIGVTKDTGKALQLITKGCNLGSTWAGCAQLRQMH